MNLHLLRAFAAVATHMSFSRAAEATHVTQPAVSKAVRDLEDQLHISLLERSGRQIRLTEAGAALYEHARAIFALERAAIADLRARQGLERGSLTIGASKTIGTYFLPPLMARFLQRYPNVEIRIISENTEAIAHRLLAYQLDLAFVEGPADDSRLAYTFWREDTLVILAPAQHPLVARERVMADDLRGERWIVREHGSGTRAVTTELLRDAGIDVQRILEVSGNDAVIQCVAAGLGVAMTSAVAASEHLAIGKVKRIGFPVRFSRPLHRVSLRDKPMSPAAEAFLTLTDDAASPLI